MNKKREQNILLLLASYVFYGFWDWRFLFLLGITTIVDFFVGKLLGEINDLTSTGRSKRKFILMCSIVVNLIILGFFKYFNFFTESFVAFFNLFGFRVDSVTLKIILPVGISFYTFKEISYNIDIYRHNLKPVKNLVDFALFVSFFPLLVAGPIERPTNLLPQIEKPRRIEIDKINVGLFLILWGFFKKMVIADNCGIIADEIFNNYKNFEGINILIGILAFTFQIYGDFSGYSDMARGIARLMGFELMINFRLPYFAINPRDFWRRWHISLSSWFRDYLYIPLGGNRKGTIITYRNMIFTMLLTGLWHGAAWNFVIWGAYHGLIMCIYQIFESNPGVQNTEDTSPTFYAIVGIKILGMFVLTLIGWTIFRSTSVHQIYYMITKVSFLTSIKSGQFAFQLVFFTLPLILIQIYQFLTRDLLILTTLPAFLRVLLYSFMVIWILVFGVRESIEFIYFQF